MSVATADGCHAAASASWTLDRSRFPISIHPVKETLPAIDEQMFGVLFPPSAKRALVVTNEPIGLNDVIKLWKPPNI